MKGSLWVCAAALCLGCGSKVDLGGGTHNGANAGTHNGPDAGVIGVGGAGNGGTTGVDAGVSGAPGMDAGVSGAPGMDAGVAGSPGMDAGVGGCGPTVLAQSTFPTQYWGLALDADNVYWFSFDSTGDQLNWIEEVPKSGGTPQKLGTTGSGPVSLSSSNSDLIYAASATGLDHGSVGRVSKSTGKGSALVNNVMAYDAVANSTTVFFTADLPGGTPAGVRLEMVPRGGGQVTTLSSVVLTGTFFEPAGPVVDGNDVYWIKPGQPMTLEHINPILAMPAATLASGAFQGGAQTLALSGGKLFYIDHNGNTGLNDTMDVETVGTSGGQSTTVAHNTNAARVVADGGEVFWRNGGTYMSGDPGFYKDDGSIQKAPATGGTPVTLVSGLTGGQGPGVLAIAVDATNLYWIENDAMNGYRIMRTCR